MLTPFLDNGVEERDKIYTLAGIISTEKEIDLNILYLIKYEVNPLDHILSDSEILKLKIFSACSLHRTKDAGIKINMDRVVAVEESNNKKKRKLIDEPEEVEVVTTLGDRESKFLEANAYKESVLEYLQQPFDLKAKPWDNEQMHRWFNNLLYDMRLTPTLDYCTRHVIVEFNKHFAWIDGKVMMRTYDARDMICTKLVSLIEFRQMLATLFIRLPVRATKKKKGEQGGVVEVETWKQYMFCDLWLASRERRQYSGYIFDPRPEEELAALTHLKNYFNTYVGLKYNPTECFIATRTPEYVAKAEILNAHIFFKMCNGKTDTFRYLMLWLALRIRRPWLKPHTMIILHGHEGIGKSSWINAVCSIFGPHYYVCSAMNKSLKSCFNHQFQSKLVIVMEEGFWAGNQENASIFKV
jgi:hypothetical protein